MKDVCKPEECPYKLDCEPWKDHEGEPYPDYCPYLETGDKNDME